MGNWNGHRWCLELGKYGKGIEDLGQTLLPKVGSTNTYHLWLHKGWAVSKQSREGCCNPTCTIPFKRRKTIALETYTIPTAESLKYDSEILEDPVLTGFTRQAELGTPAPTLEECVKVYDAISPAFEQVYTAYPMLKQP